MTAADETNGAALEAEIGWFARLLDLRFRVHTGEAAAACVVEACPPPSLDRVSAYASALSAAELTAEERLAAILAALPWLRPQALDPLLIRNQSSNRRFTEFGGAPAEAHSGFRPTQETALFLLAGESMPQRLAAMRLFAPDARLFARRVLAPSGSCAPWTPLDPHPDWLSAVIGVR